MKLSVVIVTHNPDRTRLRRVCDAICAQTLGADTCELILVDNLSSPPLSSSLLSGVHFEARLLREERLGTSYARQTGIAAASGEVIVFVDDDNVLACNYLSEAIEFLRHYPAVGAVGGAIEPEFETPLPEWLRAHQDLLAVRSFGDAVLVSSERDTKHQYPWFAPIGAGMALRTACAHAYVAAARNCSHSSVGRKGTKFLGGCEDAEIVLFGVLRTGYDVAYSPRLRLTHLIPARRLRFAYLSKLAYQTGVTWGTFCIRHGFMKALPRWGVYARIFAGIFRDRAWSHTGWLSWRSTSGRLVGRQHRE
jgi:glycosyltransferase involved in cell wall biosynthesis